MFDNTRDTFDIGGGYRFLTPCGNYLLGVNGFYDTTAKHKLQNWSIGADIQGRWVTISGNFYDYIGKWRNFKKTGGITTQEHALLGGDFEGSIPIPYMPWLRFGAGYYHYEKKSRKLNTNGYIVRAEANLTGFLSIEGGRMADRYVKNDYFQLQLRLGCPNRIQYSLYNSLKNMGMFPKRDLRRLVLEPVRRNNVIRSEKKLVGSNGITVGRGS